MHGAMLSGLAVTAALNLLAAVSMNRGRGYSLFWAVALILPLVAISYVAFVAFPGPGFNAAERFLVVAFGGIIAALGAAPVIACVLHWVDHGFAAKGQAAVLQEKPVLRSRAAVGTLERIIAYAAVVAGQVEVVALIVVLKVFSRDSDVKSSAVVGERYLLATLISLAWSGG